jgi:conjugal transfer pilin signal peptidase TrbI
MKPQKIMKRLHASLALAILLIFWLTNGLVVVLTPSIVPTLLWKLEGTPAKDEFVNFDFQHPLLGDKPLSMTKQIGCYQGELLTRKADVHFYCAGRYLGVAKTTSVDGRQMPLFNWDGGVVPAGQVFVVGSHVDSFDSRYWGFVALDDLQRLRVVW